MKYFESILAEIVPFLIRTAGKIVLALLVLAIGLKLVKFLLKLWTKSKGYAKIEPAAASFLKSCFNIVGKILVFITVIAVLGIPTTSIIAVISSAGLAVGLALQGGLSNFAGGIIILITKPFKKGDVITVEGDTGTVSSIDIFYTHLVTSDNRAIVIPNGTITNSSITNISKFPTRRIDMLFSASYNSDIERVKEVLLEAAYANDYVDKSEKLPFAAVSSYGDSDIKFLLRIWCKSEDYWNTNYTLQEEVKRAFDKNSIEIPYPHMQIVQNNTNAIK